MKFDTFWRLKFTKSTKFRAPKLAKTTVLQILDSQKLISRKIWVIGKSWNFHTVKSLCSKLVLAIIAVGFYVSVLAGASIQTWRQSFAHNKIVIQFCRLSIYYNSIMKILHCRIHNLSLKMDLAAVKKPSSKLCFVI